MMADVVIGHYGKKESNMNNNRKEQRSSWGGFSSLLQVAFIVLKLTHVIDWSWWWVLSPLWGTIAILLIGVFVIFIISREDEE